MNRTIAIYGPIGAGGVTADDFRAKLFALGKGAVTVRVNSPGGDVFEGLAIFNLIRSHGEVTVVIDGLAASAASFIALAAKRVTIAKEAMLMVHAAMTRNGGHAEDLREQAVLMDKISDQMADIYAKRIGKDVSEVHAWFAQGDKWFTADEAKAAGLVDDVLVDEQVKMFAHAWRFASAPASIAAKLDPITALQSENARLTAELAKARTEAATARVNSELIGITMVDTARAALAKSFLSDEAGTLAVIAAMKTQRPRGTAPLACVSPGVAELEPSAVYTGYMNRLSNRR